MNDSARPVKGRGMRLAYPVELGGSTRMVEVPVVVGVIGDFGLMPSEGRPALRDRRFKRLYAEDMQHLAASQGSGHPVQRLAPMVELADAIPPMRIGVLDATKAELAADLQSAPAVDQSALWKMIYEHEFGTFGGEPYTMMLVDFSFTAGSADVDILKGFARIGADASCPFIAAAAPRMFAAEQWDGLAEPERLDALFASRPYAGWHALRERDEARFVALTVFGDALDTGAALLRAYATTGLWTDAGPQAGDAARPGPEMQLDDALARHGFLVSHAALRDARTAQRAKRYHQPETTALGELTARLAHVLTSSQFLRTVTCVARDAVGTFGTMADSEAMLNRWLQDYVDDGESADGDSARALRPLAEANLQLNDVIGAPGEIEAVLNLRINLPDVQSERCARYAMRSIRHF
jgi:type VI secretion system protein ImpC